MMMTTLQSATDCNNNPKQLQLIKTVSFDQSFVIFFFRFQFLLLFTFPISLRCSTIWHRHIFTQDPDLLAKHQPKLKKEEDIFLFVEPHFSKHSNKNKPHLPIPKKKKYSTRLISNNGTLHYVKVFLLCVCCV